MYLQGRRGPPPAGCNKRRLAAGELRGRILKKETKRKGAILLRRGLLFMVDLLIVCFSFYLGLLLRADGAPDVDVWWPHNLALLYENLPWIAALYMLSFLVGGLYTILWKYAGERDLFRLAVMVAVPTVAVYFVNRSEERRVGRV